MNGVPCDDVLNISDNLPRDKSFLIYNIWFTNPPRKVLKKIRSLEGYDVFTGTLEQLCTTIDGRGVLVHYSAEKRHAQPVFGTVNIPIQNAKDLIDVFKHLSASMRTIYLSWPALPPQDASLGNISTFRDQRQEAGDNKDLWDILIQIRNTAMKDLYIQVKVINPLPDVGNFSGSFKFLGSWLGPLAVVNAQVFWLSNSFQKHAVDSVDKFREVMGDERAHNLWLEWPQNAEGLRVKKEEEDAWDAANCEGGSAKSQKAPAVDEKQRASGPQKKRKRQHPKVCGDCCFRYGCGKRFSVGLD